MAVDRGTPARSRFRTAVRRKSCGMRSDSPAAVQAIKALRRRMDELRADLDAERGVLEARLQELLRRVGSAAAVRGS